MMGPSRNYELGKMQHEEYEATVRKYWAHSKTAGRPVLAKKWLVRWSSIFAISVALFHRLTLHRKLASGEQYDEHYAGPLPEGCINYYRNGFMLERGDSPC